MSKINVNPNHVISKSQKQRIKEAMIAGAVLTPLDGLYNVGTMKLTTRVSELIREGFPVIKEWVKITNRDGHVVKVMSYRYGGVTERM